MHNNTRNIGQSRARPWTEVSDKKEVHHLIDVPLSLVKNKKTGDNGWMPVARTTPRQTLPSCKQAWYETLRHGPECVRPSTGQWLRPANTIPNMEKQNDKL